MYSCKLFGSYPCNHELIKNLKKIFLYLILVKVYLHVSEFSNGVMESGPNNGRSKTGVLNMSTSFKSIGNVHSYYCNVSPS